MRLLEPTLWRSLAKMTKILHMPKALEEQFREWLKTCPVEVTFVQDNSSEGYVGYAVDFELNPNPHKEKN